MKTSHIFEIIQVAFYGFFFLGNIGVYIAYGRTTITFRVIAVACAFAVAADSVLLAYRNDNDPSSWLNSVYILLSGLSQLWFNSVVFTLFRIWILSMNNILSDKSASIAMFLGNVLNILTLTAIIVSMVFLQLIPDLVSTNTGAIVVWAMAGAYTLGEVLLASICLWLMLSAGVNYTVSPEFERKRKQLMQLIMFCIASAASVFLIYPGSYWNYPLVTSGWQTATTAVYLTFAGNVIYWLVMVYWIFPRVLEGFQTAPHPSGIVGQGKEEFMAVKH